MSDEATLTVHAQAIAPARPDYLLVHISISDSARTSAEALDNAGRHWEMLTSALAELEIEPERRSGSSVMLNPRYRPTPGDPEIDGWIASGRMSVRLTSGTLATELVDRIAAIPGTQLSAWNWVIAPENPAHVEAGQNAVAAARVRAEAIAAALGRSLGALAQASDGDTAGPRPLMVGGPVLMAARAGGRPGLPVEEGWSQVVSSVELTFRLE